MTKMKGQKHCPKTAMFQIRICQERHQPDTDDLAALHSRLFDDQPETDDLAATVHVGQGDCMQKPQRMNQPDGTNLNCCSEIPKS